MQFTICQNYFQFQRYEGLNLSANREKKTVDLAEIMTSQV